MSNTGIMRPLLTDTPVSNGPSIRGAVFRLLLETKTALTSKLMAELWHRACQDNLPEMDGRAASKEKERADGRSRALSLLWPIHDSAELGSIAPSIYNITTCLPSTLPSRRLVPLFSHLRPSIRSPSFVLSSTLSTLHPRSLLHFFASSVDTALTSSTALRLSVVSSPASRPRQPCILTDFPSLCASGDLPSAALLFIIVTTSAS